MMNVSTIAGEIQRKTLATSCIRRLENHLVILKIMVRCGRI
jgi:hypothetical protein